MDFYARAQRLFASASERVEGRIDGIMAEHSAAGALRSGATVKAAIDAYDEESTNALTQSLDEMAKLIEHRGRAWNSAVSQIQDALAQHIAGARVTIEPALQAAGATENNAISGAVDGRIENVRTKLESQLGEFDEGWTAPREKEWRNRHPYLDRLLFLIIGALVSGLVAFVFSQFTATAENSPPPSSAPESPAAPAARPAGSAQPAAPPQSPASETGSPQA